MTPVKKRPLTQKGYQKLIAERDELMRKVRPKVVKGIADAAAEGDRSENAEYIYGKKHLREIDKRLQYLSGLLKDIVIVEEHQLQGEKVCFGSTAVVRDEEGSVRKWTVVGDGEADYKEGSISHLSPVGKALLGRSVGDIVEITRPKGVAEVEVIGVLFGDRLVVGKNA